MMPDAEALIGGCHVRGEADRLSVRKYPAGPALVRGALAVTYQGREVGIRRRVIAICRCSHSRSAPMCDGTHRFVPAFRDALDQDQPAARILDELSDERPAVHASRSA